MKKRKILDGEYVDEYDLPITLKVITKAPGKWMLIDLENGKKYIGTKYEDIGRNWQLISDE